MLLTAPFPSPAGVRPSASPRFAGEAQISVSFRRRHGVFARWKRRVDRSWAILPRVTEPTVAELSQQLADTRQMVLSGQAALNITWTLLTGFLVMFMQAGFALVETGLTRAKNVAHTMGMNFLVYSIGVIGFWAVGFGLQMGGVGALSTFGNDATLSGEFIAHIGGKELGLFGTRG